MPNRIAIYPGSFDPPTFGHLDLIRRASEVFPRLIVGVARNATKEVLFSVDERIEMIKETTKDMSQVEVTSFTGLTADFARECKATALVRGLRAISDFEFELTMAITNQKLYPEVETIYFMPSEPYLFLSSRLVKEIAGFGGDTSPFVPPEVAERLKARLAENS